MTTVQILEEQKRLEIYLKQQRDNLPQSIYSEDAGVKRANKRLGELSSLLDTQMKLSKEQEAEEAKKMEVSKKLMEEINTDLKEVLEGFEEKFKKLHHMHKGRFFEMKTELRRLVR